jgi:hypothetical protein
VLLLELQLHQMQLQLLRRHHQLPLLLLLQHPAATWTCRPHADARQQTAVVIAAAALLRR